MKQNRNEILVINICNRYVHCIYNRSHWIIYSVCTYNIEIPKDTLQYILWLDPESQGVSSHTHCSWTDLSLSAFSPDSELPMNFKASISFQLVSGNTAAIQSLKHKIMQVSEHMCIQLLKDGQQPGAELLLCHSEFSERR